MNVVLGLTRVRNGLSRVKHSIRSTLSLFYLEVRTTFDQTFKKNFRKKLKFFRKLFIESGLKVHLFLVKITRKPWHAMANIVTPLYLLSFMACLSFLIPATGGERVGLVVTVCLAVVFVTATIESAAAPSGDMKPPELFKFIRYVTWLCVVSLCDAIFYLYHQEKGGLILPKWIINLFSNKCIQSIFIKYRNCFPNHSLL